MHCEIISIGSELTSGQNLDTNSQWLSRRLAEIGIAVGWHTTIADDLDINVEAFTIAARRAALVLATGGLGPTQDDLTREALAALAGVELVLDETSLEHIRQLFGRRGRPMAERNRVQALFPMGAEPIPPSAFDPKDDSQRRQVLEYALVWNRTEPEPLPTHHFESLSFDVTLPSNSAITDKAKAKEYAEIVKNLDELLAPYEKSER